MQAHKSNQFFLGTKMGKFLLNEFGIAHYVKKHNLIVKQIKDINEIYVYTIWA